MGQKIQSMSVKHYGVSLKTMYKYMKNGMLDAFNVYFISILFI